VRKKERERERERGRGGGEGKYMGRESPRRVPASSFAMFRFCLPSRGRNEASSTGRVLSPFSFTSSSSSSH